MKENTVLCEEIPMTGGLLLGMATLNRPAALNALTTDMIQDLLQQFQKWASNPQVVLIVLKGQGEKAFCAGGDVRKLYELSKNQDYNLAEDFFFHEYRLDYWIHQCPKPLLVWGHGLVMGGGLGLLQGASYRVVTESSKLAMPEINIGLFPDVGGSFFLSRLPGKMGLFLGLTAYTFNAQDAIDLKMADYILDDQDSVFWERLPLLPWSSSQEKNENLLKELLTERQKSKSSGFLLQQQNIIDQGLQGQSILEVKESLAQAAAAHEWMRKAEKVFRGGSPSSAALIFEQLRRGKDLDLKEAFEQEFIMASQCLRRHDLREGVRALLVDKDRNPQWQPSQLTEVSADMVASYFLPPSADFRSLF